MEVQMKSIHIDIETFSSADLAKGGVYRYVESPDFEILLFGYSVDDGEVEVVDLACGERIPEEIIEAIKGKDVIKTAHNANFERVCLSRYLGMLTGDYLDPSSWRCTMVWSAYMGLPLSLAGVGTVLGLEKQKLEEGKELIRFFCTPRTPTKNNPATRNYPQDAPEKWDLFKKYNVRDVEVETQIQDSLSKFPVPDFVWEEWFIDQQINDRGVELDMVLARNAIDMDTRSKEELKRRMQQITELENPNSVQQMREWLADNGLETESLGKKEVKAMANEAEGEIKEVLTLRQQLAKSSVSKYKAMENAVCADGRVRGCFQFYGANRTGRFAGKIVQLQNLPQNHLADLKGARELVRRGDYEAVKMLYDDVPDTLSQLIRTAFVPKKGSIFLQADFSAIEARVLSWFAGEEWRTEVFVSGGDIYCASASQMFKVPVVKGGENGHLRQKGKIAELALGYGGGVGALKAMGALEMGLAEEELQPLVTAWRNANPNIVKFWWSVDKAAMEAVKKKTTVVFNNLTFSYQSGFLFITLPSGRRLAYVKPRIGKNQFDSDAITYEGVGTAKKWERQETYGPKLVENIVQATSRDILCYAMKNLKNERICMHIHDELVIEGNGSLEEICDIMGQTPSWAEGLVLRADGDTMEFYQKA